MIAYYYLNLLKVKLIKGLKNTAGRNFLGRICIFGRGSGQKRRYRYIDFFRRLNSYGTILKFYRDPIRTAKLALILYLNGFAAYSLVQQGVIINQLIYAGNSSPNNIDFIKNGYSLILKYMPLFTSLSNIELKPLLGSKLVRAASVNAIIIVKNQNFATIKLNSNWLLNISIECIASMGRMSSIFFNDIIIGKAGKNRALGFRPKVRGVAKNPCDHPHGGGNGKKAKPTVPVNA